VPQLSLKLAQILKVFQHLTLRFVCMTIHRQPINKITPVSYSYSVVDVHLYKNFLDSFLHMDTPLYQICACVAKNGLKLVSLCAPKPVVTSSAVANQKT